MNDMALAAKLKRIAERLSEDDDDVEDDAPVILRAAERLETLTEALALVRRMKLFPDDKINRTTLQAAIHIAQAAE